MMTPYDLLRFVLHHLARLTEPATRWACRTSGKATPFAAWACVVGWVGGVAVIVIPSTLRDLLYFLALLWGVGMTVAWPLRLLLRD